MKVMVFGATGMVGQGVLLECLRDPDVAQVATVRARRDREERTPKLTEIVLADMTSYGGIEDRLRGFDACFFCLGVSSAGMKEADYERVTFDLTLVAAETLARINPGMTFIYVSGMGTDSTERGRTMWARVKGRTENALLRLPLLGLYVSPGSHRAPGWNPFKDGALSNALRGGEAGVVSAASAHAQPGALNP